MDEVKSQIAEAVIVFNRFKFQVMNRSNSIELRTSLKKSYAWSTFLSGCEAWNINNELG